jgi:hypothetical protein
MNRCSISSTGSDVLLPHSLQHGSGTNTVSFLSPGTNVTLTSTWCMEPVSVTQSICRRMNWKGYGRKLWVRSLKYCATTSLERLRNTTKLRVVVVSAAFPSERVTNTSQKCCCLSQVATLNAWRYTSPSPYVFIVWC